MNNYPNLKNLLKCDKKPKKVIKGINQSPKDQEILGNLKKEGKHG
jgi:hypothetical protein